jgi:hypothetical protein
MLASTNLKESVIWQPKDLNLGEDLWNRIIMAARNIQ